jgi:hypothetical protein
MDSPARLAAKRENCANSMRDYLGEQHVPGWLHTRVTAEDDSEDGYHSESVWKRVGYLKWMTVEDINRLSSATIRIRA